MPARLKWACESLRLERVWEYLKERYLSLRLHSNYGAIVDAACVAWNKLTAETGRLASLTWLPWQPRETTRVKT